MPILYSLVARDQTVLAEYATASGNFISVTRLILEKVTSTDTRKSYAYDRHVFHYMVKDGLTFLCMADEAFQRRIAFAFLEDIRNRFMANYSSSARRAMAFGMNEEFARVLSTQMNFYSNDPAADKISEVKKNIDETKAVMVDNIERILERGERIELLVDRTENLSTQSHVFHSSSRKLKYAMCLKNVKMWIAIFVIGAVLIWLIASFACGFNFKKCSS